MTRMCRMRGAPRAASTWRANAGATNFGGSTGREWITVVGYVYLVMQDPTKVGRAAAASFVLLIIILIITLLQTLASKRKAL